MHLNVIAIAAGVGHSLALKSDGTVLAWGQNGAGESTVPTNLSGVIGIAAGGYHSLAVKSDGTVVAWGCDNYGQSTVPVNLSGAVAISGGDYHTLAIVVPVALQILLSGTNVVLSWPLSAAGLVLETTDQLTPSSSWTAVTNSPFIVNSQCTVTNQISGGNRFYRLRR
jgi:hypothetical protein